MKLVGPVDTVGDFESEIFFGCFLFDFYFDFWPPIYLLARYICFKIKNMSEKYKI